MGIFVNKHTFKEHSLDTAKYLSNKDYVLRKLTLDKKNIREDFVMPKCEEKYMKWVDSKAVEMTAQEKQWVDDNNAAIELQQTEDGKDVTKITDTRLLAGLYALADRLFSSRTEYKDTVKTEYDNLTGE